MKKPREFFRSEGNTSQVEESPVVEIHCPSCHTLFNKDDAPWLKQAEHCPKHDRVRLSGTKCEFCEAEENSASLVTEK